MKTQPSFLIVEDVQTDAELISIWLERFHADIICVPNVEQALDWSKKRRFHAVFINMCLGPSSVLENRLKGLEVIKHYREREKDLPIYVVSGFDDPETKVKARQAGATWFFSKDANSADTQYIETHLRERLATLEACRPNRWKSPKAWLHGLAAAFVGGGATTGKAWMATLVAHQFNPKVPVLEFSTLWAVFIAGAITSVFAYLHKSPLPGAGAVSDDTAQFERDNPGWKYHDR